MRLDSFMSLRIDSCICIYGVQLYLITEHSPLQNLRKIQISLLDLCTTFHCSTIDESCINVSSTPIFLASYIIICKTQLCVFMSTSYTITLSVKKSFTYLFHLETLLVFLVINKLVYIEVLLNVVIPSDCVRES